ncbi:hypothetical protein MMC08_002499 [Hypocenomyce scalaris]|nr:hypothetical protein [Hypocenomyce scalaris]
MSAMQNDRHRRMGMTWLESSDRRWARSGSAHPASVQKIVVRYSLPGERKRRAESKKKEKKPVNVSDAEEIEVGKWVRPGYQDAGPRPGAVQWPSLVERRRDKKTTDKAEPEKETGRIVVDKGAAVQARWGRPATLSCRLKEMPRRLDKAAPKNSRRGWQGPSSSPLLSTGGGTKETGKREVEKSDRKKRAGEAEPTKGRAVFDGVLLGPHLNATPTKELPPTRRRDQVPSLRAEQRRPQCDRPKPANHPVERRQKKSGAEKAKARRRAPIGEEKSPGALTAARADRPAVRAVLADRSVLRPPTGAILSKGRKPKKERREEGEESRKRRSRGEGVAPHCGRSGGGPQ